MTEHSEAAPRGASRRRSPDTRPSRAPRNSARSFSEEGQPVIDTPARHATMPVPRRLVTDSPDHAGIIIGHDVAQLRAVRRWVAQSAHVTTSLSMDMRTVVSELVTNSLRHSKSGRPGGQTVVELIHAPGTVLLRVTDDGPLQPHTWPESRPEQEGDELSVGGMGLALVESLCSFWDWSYHHGRTCVSAHFRRSP